MRLASRNLNFTNETSEKIRIRLVLEESSHQPLTSTDMLR